MVSVRCVGGLIDVVQKVFEFKVELEGGHRGLCAKGLLWCTVVHQGEFSQGLRLLYLGNF